MNLQRTKIPRASQHDMGWKAPRTFPLLPVAGELFPLTFPFIERVANFRGGNSSLDYFLSFPFPNTLGWVVSHYSKLREQSNGRAAQKE